MVSNDSAAETSPIVKKIAAYRCKKDRKLDFIKRGAFCAGYLIKPQSLAFFGKYFSSGKYLYLL